MTDGERMILRALGRIEGRLLAAEQAIERQGKHLGKLLDEAAELRGTRRRRAAHVGLALAGVGTVAAATQAVVQALHG